MTRFSDTDIRRTIHALLAGRASDATICPSEVSRALAPAPQWRDLMDDVRRVAAAEHAAGRLEFRQHGERVEPETAKGPIRLGRLSGNETVRPPGPADA